MSDSGITHKALEALKAIDQFGVFKNITHANVVQEFKNFKNDVYRNGLGWQHTDGATYGVQVNDVKMWATYMVLLYERRSASTLNGVVYFKLAIDSRCHWNRGGQVYLLFHLQFQSTYNGTMFGLQLCIFYHMLQKCPLLNIGVFNRFVKYF
jgi:hypothetical protein